MLIMKGNLETFQSNNKFYKRGDNIVKMKKSIVIEDTKDFISAADILYRELNVDDNEMPARVDLGIPFTLVATYAIESGIKNLLIAYKINYPCTHDLKKLFKLLPNKIQTKIITSERANWYLPSTDSKQAYEQASKIFNDLLKKSKGLFVGSRYFFEKQSGNSLTVVVSFLHLLPHIIYDILLEHKVNN